MVALPRHNRRDRLIVASLQGTARRMVDQRIPRDEAIAELHQLTADPHLLGHAWSHPDRYGMPMPWADAVNELLEAAGADPQPPGWE